MAWRGRRRVEFLRAPFKRRSDSARCPNGASDHGDRLGLRQTCSRRSVRGRIALGCADSSNGADRPQAGIGERPLRSRRTIGETMRVIAAACALLAAIGSVGSQAQSASSPVPQVPGQALVASDAAGAQAAGDTESATSVLLGMVDFVPQTVLEFCEFAAPELQAQLTAEATRFKTRSHRAVAPYVGRLAVDGATTPGPSGAELDNMRQMMLASLAKNEPHSFCSGYVVRLRDADVDALAADAWEKYEAVTAAAKARRAQ